MNRERSQIYNFTDSMKSFIYSLRQTQNAPIKCTLGSIPVEIGQSVSEPFALYRFQGIKYRLLLGIFPGNPTFDISIRLLSAGNCKLLILSFSIVRKVEILPHASINRTNYVNNYTSMRKSLIKILSI